ncbi:MAG: hypothetical protein JNM44_09010 [Chitinophagaceae bacterium]|nr:hypothetical protein [Chitinophagaceae bacterium]
MTRYFLLILCGMLFSGRAMCQYAFELKVTYATRIQNSDQYSISGTLLSGRIESGKTYYLENGSKIEVKNLMSAKTATSVPVAAAPEGVSVGLISKDYEPESRMILRGNATRSVLSGSAVSTHLDKIPEGVLRCKLNGRLYEAVQISKPVYIKQSNVLDLFFQAEDQSVIWLQINGFSDIRDTPHKTSSDTSQKDYSLMCKVAFLPKGYRPTDMPLNYLAYEDVKGNSGITIRTLDRYRKKIALEFSGILRPNARMLDDKPGAGLFYITDGRVDHVGWDEF